MNVKSCYEILTGLEQLLATCDRTAPYRAKDRVMVEVGRSFGKRTVSRQVYVEASHFDVTPVSIAAGPVKGKDEQRKISASVLDRSSF